MMVNKIPFYGWLIPDSCKVGWILAFPKPPSHDNNILFYRRRKYRHLANKHISLVNLEQIFPFWNYFVAVLLVLAGGMLTPLPLILPNYPPPRNLMLPRYLGSIRILPPPTPCTHSLSYHLPKWPPLSPDLSKLTPSLHQNNHPQSPHLPKLHT